MAKGKIGKPTRYTKKIANYICKELSKGKSLNSISKEDGIPHEATIRDWVIKDYNGFTKPYNNARNIGIDIQIEGLIDYIQDEKINIATRQLVANTRKWHIGKIAPKKYGDRAALDLGGQIDNPIPVINIIPSKTTKDEE